MQLRYARPSVAAGLPMQVDEQDHTTAAEGTAARAAEIVIA